MMASPISNDLIVSLLFLFFFFHIPKFSFWAHLWTKKRGRFMQISIASSFDRSTQQNLITTVTDLVVNFPS